MHPEISFLELGVVEPRSHCEGNTQKWREVTLCGHICEVIHADGLQCQGPTNSHTVSSHDQDCHTTPLTAPGPLAANGTAFFLEHTTGDCRVIAETRSSSSPPKAHKLRDPAKQSMARVLLQQASKFTQHEQRELRCYFIIPRGTRASLFASNHPFVSLAPSSFTCPIQSSTPGGVAYWLRILGAGFSLPIVFGLHQQPGRPLL